ncbi:MAG: NlpC/P60 family protein [Anaerovoracaceae bacterium]
MILNKKQIKKRLMTMAVAFVVTTSFVAAGGGGQIIAYAMEDNTQVIKAGEEELAVVSSKAEADKVIESVIGEYTGSLEEVKDVNVYPALTVEPVSTILSEPAMETEPAVSRIIETNKEDNKFEVKAEGTSVLNKEIEFKTIVKEKRNMAKGQKKVARQGINGITKYVKAQTVVNGAVVDSKNIDRKVVKPTVSKVVYEGTLDRQKIIETAKKYLGNPYVYGGNSLTTGTDCSGFVKLIFAKFGFNLPRTSGAYQSIGKAVSYKDAKPGDILCYSGHVGIYAGNGKIIHASSPEVGIVMWNADYREIKCVRRIIN